MSDVAVETRPTTGDAVEADPGRMPTLSSIGGSRELEQMELYARDVGSLHEQRASLAEQVRRVEHRLAVADAEQKRLRDRLEREFARAQALEAERKVRAEGRPIASTARGRPVGLIVGLVVGVTATAIGGAVLVALAGGYLMLAGWTAGPGGPTPIPTAAATATPAAPIVVSTQPKQAAGTPTPEPDSAGRANATPAAGAVVDAAKSSPTALPRCATDLSVPPLAAQAAFVTRIKQERTEPVTLMWSGVKGKIGLAAAGTVAPLGRTPAVVPQAQLPPQLRQAATAGPELTTTAPAGYVYAVLINDSTEQLPASRGVLFYAGGPACA